jgi:hypothetical protein
LARLSVCDRRHPSFRTEHGPAGWLGGALIGREYRVILALFPRHTSGGFDLPDVSSTVIHRPAIPGRDG